MKPKAIAVFDHPATPSSSNSNESISDCNNLDAAIEWLMQRRLLIWVFLFCMASVCLRAQEPGGIRPGTEQGQKSSGTVNGRATDPQNSALQGARVELQPTGLTAVSDSEGHFTIQGVPVGTYTLTVSYIGFSPFSTSITVKAGAANSSRCRASDWVGESGGGRSR